MKRIAFACSLLLIISLTCASARAESYTGTWRISPGDSGGKVDLRLEYRRLTATGSEEWSEENDVPASDLHRNAGGFTLVRDAGTFQATGVFNGGQGAGTWTFVPSVSFAAELARRGVSAPSEKQQFHLAIAGFKLSTLDSLLAAGFQRPTPGDLEAMVEHGVTADYIDGLKGVRFQPKTIGELIRLRDHGVSPQYAANMMRRAPQLAADDLIALQDHGVSSSYMAALAAAGYGNVPPSDAERMLDHGVSSDFLNGLRRLGYHPSVDDLVRLVDHGVNVSFIERMRSHGYTHLSVDDLIRLRDHGF